MQKKIPGEHIDDPFECFYFQGDHLNIIMINLNIKILYNYLIFKV